MSEWALVGVIVLLWAVLVWCWYSYTVGHREVQQSRARRRENRDAEVERLRSALEWYAAEENYEGGTDDPRVIYDNGDIARAALARTRSKE